MGTTQIQQFYSSNFAKLVGYESLDGGEIELTGEAPVMTDLNIVPPPPDDERFFLFENVTSEEVALIFVSEFAEAVAIASISLAAFPATIMFRFIRLDNSGKNLVYQFDSADQMIAMYEDDTSFNSVEIFFYGPNIPGNQFSANVAFGPGEISSIMDSGGSSGASIVGEELVIAFIRNNRYNLEQGNKSQGTGMTQPIAGPLEGFAT